mgnify:CR=1 FL=1|tara:strand:+ start:441 stop:1655 length:1215 start_codon:yes stop_codon:yes gene_type:complete
MFNIQEIRAQFPLLNQKINNNNLIYFDNAATTQKTKSVINAISNYYLQQNSNVHRGVHFLSGHATEKFEETRIVIKEFINAAKTSEIIFTKGTTDGINLIANGYRSILKKGDEIIISELEHHSNIVPWQICCENSGAILKVLPLLENGEIDFSLLDKMLSNKTKLIAISHVSNSLGTINPVENIIKKAHKNGTKVLVDGAQAASHISLNMQKLNADFYVFSAHKMYGPTGVGVLYGKEALLKNLPVYQGGGEMIENVDFDKTSYAALPHKFEAGTPNIAGVIAFKKAINFISKIGLENIKSYEENLLDYATQKILKIEGVKIYGSSKNKTGIISFNIKEIHPYDIGVILDKLGIAIRTGHHCTQPVMKRFNIPGTARISFAIYNTKKEVDFCINAIKKAKEMLS